MRRMSLAVPEPDHGGLSRSRSGSLRRKSSMSKEDRDSKEVGSLDNNDEEVGSEGNNDDEQIDFDDLDVDLEDMEEFAKMENQLSGMMHDVEVLEADRSKQRDEARELKEETKALQDHLMRTNLGLKDAKCYDALVPLKMGSMADIEDVEGKFVPADIEGTKVITAPKPELPEHKEYMRGKSVRKAPAKKTTLDRTRSLRNKP